MWLAFLLLFIALSPGVVFTAPRFGIKALMRGKLDLLTIFLHGLLFVAVVQLLRVTESFQPRRGPPVKQDDASGSTPYDFLTGVTSTSQCNTRRPEVRTATTKVQNARRELNTSVESRTAPYKEAQQMAYNSLDQYEETYWNDVHRQIDEAKTALTTQKQAIYTGDPILAPLHQASEDAYNGYRASTNRLTEARKARPQNNATIRAANTEKNAATRSLQAARAALKRAEKNNSQLQILQADFDALSANLNSEARFEAYKAQRPDIYTAITAARTTYDNEKNITMQLPENKELQKTLALAIYNRELACKGYPANATSVPFSYYIFGVLFEGSGVWAQ